MAAKKKVAIIVGHTKASAGSVAYNGQSEYVFNSEVAKLIEKQNKAEKRFDLRTFFRDQIGIAGVAQQVAEQMPDCDLSLELHLNSFDKVALGCECLIAYNATHYPEADQAADLITDAISKEFGIKQRHDDGVLVVKEGGRGFRNLYLMDVVGKVKAPLLIEPAFCNFRTDESLAIIENPDKYAATLYNFFTDFLK